MKYCPIIRGECKGSDCMLWLMENCGIVHYISNVMPKMYYVSEEDEKNGQDEA